MKILEVGSSLGHSTRILSFLFKRVIAIDTLSERHTKSSKLNYDRNNIDFIVMDVYNQQWNFEHVDVVFIDCVHDYKHVKKDVGKLAQEGKIEFDDKIGFVNEKIDTSIEIIGLQ